VGAGRNPAAAIRPGGRSGHGTWGAERRVHRDAIRPALGRDADHPEFGPRWRLRGPGGRNRNRRRALGGGAAGEAGQAAASFVAGRTVVPVMQGGHPQVPRGGRILPGAVVRGVPMAARGSRGLPQRGTRQDKEGQREQTRDDPPEPARAPRHPWLPYHPATVSVGFSSLRPMSPATMTWINPVRPGGPPRHARYAWWSPFRTTRGRPWRGTWGFPPWEGQGPDETPGDPGGALDLPIMGIPTLQAARYQSSPRRRGPNRGGGAQ
jgi:hypothetical protein